MLVAGAMFAVIAMLLKSQPDMGMLAVVGAVFFVQLFVGRAEPAAGRRRRSARSARRRSAAYTFFPHVRSRVTRFLDPSSGDNYQVNTALEAFGNGGLLGRGPGEGRVKDVLPDAHADFVFAVMGEEFGLIVCLLVLGVFGFIVLRGLLRLVAEQDLFVVLAACGLVTSFGLQSLRQHGLVAAPDPDQGHDAAVRLLWRLLGAGGRARDRHAARADPAAGARRIVGGARDEGRAGAPDRHRRRRHRRAFLPGRGAGGASWSRAATGSR